MILVELQDVPTWIYVEYDQENKILYINFVEQNKSLGVRWKKMTEEETRPYYKRAETLRIQHKQDHPEYRYRPKPKKKSKCPEGTKLEKQSILQNGGMLDRLVEPESYHPSSQEILYGFQTNRWKEKSTRK